METMILRPAFIDRAGMVVYHAFPITPIPAEDGNQMLKEGPIKAMVRLAQPESLTVDSPVNAHVEWIESEQEPLPEAEESERQAGFVPVPE
mgnify:CR=1 FL=1